jgi:hypothetical protein
MRANERLVVDARNRLSVTRPGGDAVVPAADAVGAERAAWRLTASAGLLSDDGGDRLRSFDLRLARELNATRDLVAGAFAGGEFTASEFDDGFAGDAESWQASGGLSGVTRLQEHLYVDGYAAAGYGKNSLSMREGSQSLDGGYGTFSWQVGGAMIGIIEMSKITFRPAMSLAYGNSHLGEITFEAGLGELTGSEELDVDRIALGVLRLTPELRFPTDADGTASIGLLPSVVCERTIADGASDECGWSAGISVLGAYGPADGRFSGMAAYERIGGVKAMSGSLSYSLRF